MLIPILREKMTAKGISAHALEKQAGLKSSAIHNILYGRSKNPSIKVMKAIANALDCNISDFIIDEAPKTAERTSDPSMPYVHPRGGNDKQWNSQLYLKSFEQVNSLIKNKGSSLTKEKILNIVDEIYLYSQRTGRDEVDQTFAEWLIDKSI